MPTSSAELVSIPGCKATQLLGTAKTELGEGMLLVLADPSSPKTLLLQVGQAAFALTPGSKFFTHADDETKYYFPSESPDSEAVGSGSYVQLTLPNEVSAASSHTRTLRDKFEDALLERGFLRSGPLAAFDEIGRSVAQDGSTNAATLDSNAQQHIDGTEGRDVGMPDTLRNTATTAKDATATAQGYTERAANTVADASQRAGAKVAEYLPEMPSMGESEATQEAKAMYADTADATGTLVQGVSDGSAALGSSALNATHDVIENDYGRDAVQVADDAGLAAANTGKVANDLTLGTSTIFHGAKLSEGAASNQ